MIKKINSLVFLGLASFFGFTSVYAGNPLQLNSVDAGDMTYNEIGIPLDNNSFYTVSCKITKDSNASAGLTVSSNTGNANTKMQFTLNGQDVTRGVNYTWGMVLPNYPEPNILEITNVGAADPDGLSKFHFDNSPRDATVPMVIIIQCQLGGNEKK